MKVGLEITEWKDVDYSSPNHRYKFNDDGKIVAYQKRGVGDWITFKQPLMFDMRGRKIKWES